MKMFPVWTSHWCKHSDKYYGLYNQGATCYLNSVLQVLFMTREFREAVSRFASENPYTQHIDKYLKDLFDNLLKKTTQTTAIIRELGIERVNEQQDAAEYFERILRQTSEDAAKIFHGQLTHRTSCSDCKTVTDRVGSFWHLPLELGNSKHGKYSVDEGIKNLFQISGFTGRNRMFCDTCERKVEATSRYLVTGHPDVLLLLLKRFDFSYQYMSYFKINCFVDFPQALNISEDHKYELYAIVHHVGELRGGHYFTTIKSEDGDDTRLYRFDDDKVTKIGHFQEHKNPGSYPSRSNTAYLLFYKKKDCGADDMMEVSISGDASTSKTNENVDGLRTTQDGNDSVTNQAIPSSLQFTTAVDESIVTSPKTSPAAKQGGSRKMEEKSLQMSHVNAGGDSQMGAAKCHNKNNLIVKIIETTGNTVEIIKICPIGEFKKHKLQEDVDL